MELKIDTLANVKGYPAGKNGNLLTFVVDKLQPVVVISPKGDEKPVAVMCCTATVKDSEVREYLGKMCDTITPSDKIILVSKAFMRLWNKTQLALLTIENCKANKEYRNYASAYDADTGEVFSFDQNGTIIGEVLAIERYGKIRAIHAINRAHRYRLKSEWNSTFGLHHAALKNKRQEKAMEKMRQHLEAALENIEVLDEDDVDVINATLA